MDVFGGEAPEPQNLLHVKDGGIRRMTDLMTAPTWAKPILQVALEACSND